MPINPLGQPIGEPVPNWSSRERPPRTVMQGRLVRLEPLDAERHGNDLYLAQAEDKDGRNWTYLFQEPPKDLAAFKTWLAEIEAKDDPLPFAIVDQQTHRAVGYATYLRIDPAMGVIEVGNINFSPRLQQKPNATEAMFLMMKRVFDELGYRRYEWKCDSLNAASRRAALRLGFTFEGIFRQAVVYKGRNRDTAWYSIIDKEWPAIWAEFNAWLDPGNFDEKGQQRRPLNQQAR